MSIVERRRHARYRCEVSVEVQATGLLTVCEGILADICLGGCYVSMVAPFPSGTSVSISLSLPQFKGILRGQAVTSVPGSGMGIEFTSGEDAEMAVRLQTLLLALDKSVAAG
jgi:PilZ domain